MNFVPPNKPAARAFRKQIEKANAKFGGAEVCHCCRRPLKSGEMTLVGPVGRSGLMVVGWCCQRRLKSVIGFAVWYAMRDTPAALLADIEPRGRA